MKKFIVSIFIVFILVVALTACSAAMPGMDKGGVMNSDSSHHPSSTPPSSDKTDSKPVTGGEETAIPPEISQQEPEIPAGQLTAAEWSDKDHYDSWLKKCGYDENQNKGEFYAIANESVWDLPWADRYCIKVVDSAYNPVEGVKLSLESDNNTVFSAVSDAKGNAYLFVRNAEYIRYNWVANFDGKTVSAPWTGEREQTIVLDGVSAKQNIIEIMFVIDTTGSMGDELKYLQAEIDDVIGRVKETLSDVTIRIALMFYRDVGDDYVTRYFDFNENIDVVKKNLNDQRAIGGGDYPEAVHTALYEAVNKQWSSGNVTKLLIHVLDAPPHGDTDILRSYRSSLYSAAQQGIRIIPVASSGVNKTTEYLLRMEALLTGGTYTFLTDDSGIGNSHLEPTIDEEYVVELLNSMLVRLITEYHTGEDIEPIDWRQEVKQS